jgi:hypothetical protein
MFCTRQTLVVSLGLRETTETGGQNFAPSNLPGSIPASSVSQPNAVSFVRIINRPHLESLAASPTSQTLLLNS